jgi:EAL domain-containing protein (putative c-di-GMP-specific phosphodiesterase class I)
MGHGDFRTRVSGSKAASRLRARLQRTHAVAEQRVEVQRPLDAELARCVERRQIRVVFQPLVDLASSRVVAAEALARWDHPGLGTVDPGRFIPVAERTGDIITIGRYVLDTALLQLATWNAGRDADERITMHVNVSPVQLAYPAIVHDVRRAIENSGVDPTLVVLEITESAALSSALVFDVLTALKALGVALAIDDFGTGYSSLSYLTWLPVDEIKLDRSFLTDLTREQNRTVLASMIGLAKGLGLDTVIEGIEHADQVDALVAIGARYGQGYHFDRPLPAADFADRIDDPALAALAA